MKCSGTKRVKIEFRIGVSLLFGGFGLWNGPIAEKIPKQLDRIGTKCVRNGNKLEEINPSLATFIFSDKGLWFAQRLGHRLLREARSLPHCNEQLNKTSVFR